METPADATKVFISYRRDDTAAASRLLFERLSAAECFGKERVFFDVHGVRVGVDFLTHIQQQVAGCTVMLAVIGRNWTQGRKVFDEDDFVRIEILAALQRGIPVIPIFVDGAKAPKRKDVPLVLRPFLNVHGLPLLSGADFDNHIEAVVREARRLSFEYKQRLEQLAALAMSDEPASLSGAKRPASTDAFALANTTRPATGTIWAIPKRSLIGSASGGALLAVIATFWLTRSKNEDPAQRSTGASSSAAAPASSSVPALSPSCPSEMSKIPAGQFFQGNDAKDAMPNQKPAHKVTLGAFCMDTLEVTAAQYRSCSDQGKCMRLDGDLDWPKITPSDKAAYTEVCTTRKPELAEHPVNCISWDSAARYCKEHAKRLPTEAEWEYAARGPDGRVYPWGDEAPTAEHLNACGTECLAWAKQSKVLAHFPGALYQANDGYALTAPVGMFPKGASRFGPRDIVGNVWEWVQDWEGMYRSSDQTSPAGPETGQKRVIRGGSWSASFPEWLHPSFRYAQDPSVRSFGVGFRCAKSL